jgi:hypothetical protein
MLKGRKAQKTKKEGRTRRIRRKRRKRKGIKRREKGMTVTRLPLRSPLHCRYACTDVQLCIVCVYS